MIYLAQTDTTAGFLSRDFRELNRLKERGENQPCLIATSKFSILKTLVRVPNKFKNCVRRARKTTFLYPNLKAVRVVKECKHAKFLDAHGWFYSTSANLSGQNFDENWARGVADVIVDNKFYEKCSSKILKVSIRNIKRLR
ncbi:MAG: Sua5 YciO YrdC YwlC family protein [Campylobacter sp.]|nr:Sua5 YciO YrdC YwlC family protein [Campylobacter sp.]